MRRTIAFLSALGLGALALTLLPSAPAAGPGSQDMLGLYFNDPTVTLAKPTGGANATKSLCSGATPVCEPASAQVQVLFGGIGDNGGGGTTNLKLTSDVLVTVYLQAATDKAPLRGLQVQVVDTGPSTPNALVTASWQDTIKDASGTPILLGTSPQKITLTYPKPTGATLSKTAKIGLRISALAVGSDGQPVDVALVYGSAKAPSGVFFTVDQPLGANKVASGTFRMSLADTGFTFGFPTGTTPKSKALTAGFPSAQKTTWGPMPAPKAYTLQTDTMFNITVVYPGTAPAAGQVVNLEVTLNIGARSFSGSTQLDQTKIGSDVCSTACGAAYKLYVALPTEGAVVAPGAAISVDFSLEALTSAGDYSVQYDAVTAPTGFLAGAQTAGSGSSSTAATSSSTGATTSSSRTSATSPASTTKTSTSPTGSAGAGQEEDVVAHDKDVAVPEAVLPGATFVMLLGAVAVALVAVRRRA